MVALDGKKKPRVVLKTSSFRLGGDGIELGDPIRVFQRFATVDAASNGRAEVILGRSSFTQSFPLFGFWHGPVARTVLRHFFDGCRERSVSSGVDATRSEGEPWEPKLN